MLPETRYAKSGDLHIAYQVVGNGPLDLVCAPGWISNVEYAWEEPALARFLERLASFSRLILFDKRGTGLSDRVPDNELPTLEQRMDDVRAVLDAVGSRRAALFGTSEAANLCTLFAATYPERTVALVTYGMFAKRLRSDDYPWAPTMQQREATFEEIEREWGGPVGLSDLAPSVAGDERFARWWASFLRRSASPNAAVALFRMNTFIDMRHVLPAVRVPTLLLHRTGDRDSHIEEARYIAGRIPDAKLVELPGEDHLWWVGDSDSVLEEIEAFLTGVRRETTRERVLATVMFTDIVKSTERAAELGDARWRDLLDSHNALVRRHLERYRGRELQFTGDGFLVTFDGPARAIRCACALRDAMRTIGIEIRAGLHTGECEEMGNGVGGIAVHIAARVVASAGASEVITTSTVRDLVAGSGIKFASLGMRGLKGVPGEWELLRVEH